MKTVLVTGGSGYVGSRLLPKLVDAGWKVKNFDLMLYSLPNHADKGVEHIKGDIRDIESIKKALEGVEAVIHLACISNDPSFELSPALGRSINLDSFGPLVHAAKVAGVKRFINASSSSVYGVRDEKEITEDVKCSPITDYSLFKLQTEEILNSYSGGGLIAINVRSATVCGYSPRQRLDVIVNILTNWAYHRNRIKVFGGSQLRPNVHIEDICEFYVNLLDASESDVGGQTFNFGGKNKK